MPVEARRSALSALVIRNGGDDPQGIMRREDLGRLSSIERTARLVAALLSGREITRAEATALLGVQNAAADRQLEAIGRHVPLVRERRKGRLHARIDRSKMAGAKEAGPLSHLLAACH